MAHKIILLWLAAFPLMGSPGPATISLAGVGTGFGFRNGRQYLIGIVPGTIGVLILVATGITTLVLAIPTFVTVLTTIAVVYILYLAWKIATAPILATDVTTSIAPSLASGFVLAIANPKAFAAIGAVYTSQTLINNNLIADSALKISALTVVIVVVNTAWLLFGSFFSRLLHHRILGRVANLAFAVMLLVSVALALINF